MKLRKIYFETEDKIELCGLLHEPEKETCEIVIAVHGMQREDIKAGELTDNGIAYFTFNNRGHDLVNLTNKRCDDKSFKIQCGTSLENIEDSYYDIKAAINSMLTEKYKKIHLQGHSLGCTKIVYSYNRMKQQNDNEILDKIESIKKFKVRGVIHCFSGSLETANIFMKLGFYFGVGGVMTFKNSKIDQVIKNIPLDRIILETDSPYLTPEPFRKYSNEPKYIKTIAEYLANLKGVSIEEVSSITEKNVQELYKIKK